MISDDICAACLQKQTSSSLSINENLRSIYICLTSLQIDNVENLQKGFCNQCAQKLTEFDAFRDRCIRNFNTLQCEKVTQDLSGKNGDNEPNLDIIAKGKEDTTLVENPVDIDMNEPTSVVHDSAHNSINPAMKQQSYYEIHNFCYYPVEEIKSTSLIDRESNIVDISIKESKQFKCDDCEKEFECHVLLLNHIDSVHKSKEDKRSPVKPLSGSEKLTCTKCAKKFKKLDRLEAHMRVHAGKKPEVCKICGGEYATWKSLKLHSMKHSGVKRYECSACAKRFTYPTALRIHERLHRGEREYVCDVCGNSFVTSTNLKLHQATHKDDRPFSCAVCARAFKCSATLRAHEFRHSGVKDFVCSQCGHRSTTRGELTAHMKIHSTARPFKCLVCPKTYKTSNELTVHNRMHTGERPFKCDLCPMSFTISKILKNHRMIHTGQKPHVCDVCQRAFTQKTSLKTHLKTHEKSNENAGAIPL